MTKKFAYLVTNESKDLGEFWRSMSNAEAKYGELSVTGNSDDYLVSRVSDFSVSGLLIDAEIEIDEELEAAANSRYDAQLAELERQFEELTVNNLR